MIQRANFKFNKNLRFIFVFFFFNCSRNAYANLAVHQCSAEHGLGNSATRLHGVHWYKFTIIFRFIYSINIS